MLAFVADGVTEIEGLKEPPSENVTTRGCEVLKFPDSVIMAPGTPELAESRIPCTVSVIDADLEGSATLVAVIWIGSTGCVVGAV